MAESIQDKENSVPLMDSNSNSDKSGSVLVDSNAGKGASLQDAFAKFRDRKIKDIKLQKAARKPCGERSPEFKAALRMKFVEQCKKYIGVPYAERYKQPEDPIAPLYLDCCALVRKVMDDLKEDFGFVMGKWNQAYQMDTLPKEVPFEELKPGDLIFYCGDYTSKRSKKQKHDCLHIEVFLGGETGEATIGSRYFRGKVGIFDSYKFKSTSWDCKQHYFRSLDTWLDGLCVSHCPEHPWIVQEWNAGKKSIFDTSSEEEDVSAGGEEDDDEAEAQAASCSCSCAGEEGEADMESGKKKSTKGQSSNSVVPAPSVGGDAAAADASLSPTAAGITLAKKPARVRGGASSSSADASNTKPPASSTNNSLGDKKSAAAATPHSYYVSKSNGWKLVKNALDKMDWQQLPFEYKFSSRFTLKWVERRSDIDYRSHTAGQLVCHIPNNDVITTKNGLLTSMRLYTLAKSAGGAPKQPLYSPVKKPASVLPSPTGASAKGAPPSPSRKVAPTPDSYGEGSNSNSSRRSFTNELTAMAEHIDVPWLPDTYLLDSPADCAAVIKIEEERLAANATTGGIWIYKPSSNNRGRGIKVVSGLNDLKALCYGIQTNDPDTTVAPAKGILQRYIENPLLVPAPVALPVVNAKDVYVPADAPPTDTAAAEVATSNEIDVPTIPPCVEAAADSPSNESAPSQEPVAEGADQIAPIPSVMPASAAAPVVVTEGKGGHKFDVRCYLLVARNDPSYLAYYHPGYMRLTLSPYSADPASLSDPTIHLTNAAIQKQGPLYQSMKDFQVQSPESVANLLRQNGRNENADFLVDGRMDHLMKKCMVDIVKCGMPTLTRKRGFFDLFGCDFMVTEDNELKLLEVNSNPSLSLDNKVLADMLPGVVEGAISIVLAAQGPDVPVAAQKDPTTYDNRSAVLNSLPAKYQLVYNENTKFEYS